MVVIGAGGHAIEILDIVTNTIPLDEIVFFDNVNPQASPLYSTYRIIDSWSALKEHFQTDPAFVIAVGSPSLRRQLVERCESEGGILKSVVSPRASIGDFNVLLDEGLNVMHNVIVTGDVQIGKGTLLNTAVSVHHNVRIGAFCEISPGARLLGGCSIGSGVSVGSNAVILPEISVGDNALVGAGAVVTRNVAPGVTVVGVPAKPLMQ